MLDLMRKHAGTWLIKVILGAVIIVFAFWGIGSYKMQEGTRVAVVNGNTITVDQYRDTYNRILDQLRQRFGDSLNDEMLKIFNVKQQALDSVIEQALLLDEARRLKFRVADEELAAAIRSTPAFQVNGRFDPRQYSRILSSNRMTPEGFEAVQRESMLIGKLRNAIRSSLKVSGVEARELYNWTHAFVDVDYVLFKPEQQSVPEVTPDEVKKYYDENKSAYKTDPLVKARYILFDPANYQDKIKLDDEEIAEYYNAYVETFAKPKTVEARHILTLARENDTTEKVEAARKKALDALKEIRDGKDFAETAKKYSEGPSRDSGGYLGTFEKKAMVAPFAEKAFSMGEGEVSEPVRTQFGWHIIKVEKVNPATTETLTQATPAIRKKLVEDRAKNMAYDDAEMIYDATFDRTDLSEIAKEKGVEMKATPLFSSKGPEKGVKAPGAFAAAAFDLKVDEISEVKEIEDAFYIIQVIQKVPEKISEMENIREKLKADILKKKKDEKAKATAEAFIASLNDGTPFEQAVTTFNAKPSTTGWFKRSDSIPSIGYEPSFAQTAFRLSSEKPYTEKPVKGKDGYFVPLFKARKLPDNEGFESQKDTLVQRFIGQKEAEAFAALLKTLRGKSEITIADRYRD